MPATLKATIEDWFYDRYVFSNTDFPRYFRRELANDLPQFTELLRVQPGMIKVDWFVEEYQERRAEHTGSHSSSSNGSSRTEYGKTMQDNGSTLHNGTDENDHIQDAATNYDDEQNTGSQSYGKTQTTENSDNKSNTQDSETLLKQGSKDGHREMGKNTPQSILYPGSAVNTIPDLIWQTASTQGQTEDTHQPTGTDPDTNSNKTIETGTQNGKVTDGGQDNSSGTAKRAFNRNEINKTIYNDGNTTSRHTEEGGSDGQTTNGTESGTENGEDTAITTGRHQLPAEVIRQAVSVIENTNAWDWLMYKLEPYFIGVWEV